MTDFCSISELDSKIIHCIVMRLSTKEALEYLEANGHDLKERTYFARKKELMMSNKRRIIDAVDGFVWNHFHKIDALELVQKNLWEDLKGLDDVELRLKVYGMITQNELLISKCRYDLMSVIDMQIDSYRAAEVSDRLTYAEYLKFVEKNTRDRLKNKLDSLEEKLNKPYKDPLALPDPPETEDSKKKESIRKEIEKVKSELEKLGSRDDTS